MSRYVDLDGNTWDGTRITSKIQEVKTKFGYAQGITIGWLFGDNVPHIDLEEHDKEVIQNYIDKVVEELEELREKILTDDYSCSTLDGCRHIDCDKCEQIIIADKAIEIVKRGGKNG